MRSVGPWRESCGDKFLQQLDEAGSRRGRRDAAAAAATGRRGYVHVARGSVRANATPPAAGDAVKIEREETIKLDGANTAEVLLFDLR